MLAAKNEQNVLEKLMSKDLIYTELLNELKTAHTLVSEVKLLSAELQETIDQLKNEADNRYLKYEYLPDYIDAKILKEYLKVGTNRIYELTNSPGFPKPVQYGNGKKVYAKAEVKEWLERKGKMPKIINNTRSA